MRISLFIFLGIMFLGATNFRAVQTKHLPVCINFTDSSFLSGDMILHIKGAFAMKKIRTINKVELMELIEIEARRVLIPYFEKLKNSGETVDYEDIKRYNAANLVNVANSLTISLKVDAGGFINDTIKWDNHTVPINMLDFPKRKWRYMVLDSNNAKTMWQMSQSLVDSIIASKVLVKE